MKAAAASISRLESARRDPGSDADGRIATADAAFWTRLSRKYAADPIADVAGYERTLARVAELLGPGDRVLEFGCGTGTTALQLAPNVSAYLATDLAPGMIAIAREKLAADPCPRLSFEVATAETMAGGPERWDAVLGFNWLHLVADLPGTLRAVHGLVRPGGLFLSKTACLGEMNPLIGLAIPVMRLFGKAPATVLRFTAAELQAEIAAAGFKIEAVERHGSKRKDARAFIVARAV